MSLSHITMSYAQNWPHSVFIWSRRFLRSKQKRTLKLDGRKQFIATTEFGIRYKQHATVTLNCIQGYYRNPHDINGKFLGRSNILKKDAIYTIHNLVSTHPIT